jgi:hypothetical protein
MIEAIKRVSEEFREEFREGTGGRPVKTAILNKIAKRAKEELICDGYAVKTVEAETDERPYQLTVTVHTPVRSRDFTVIFGTALAVVREHN